MRRLEEMSEKLVSLQAASKADFFGLSHTLIGELLHHASRRTLGHSALALLERHLRAASALIPAACATSGSGLTQIICLRGAHNWP